MFEYVRHRLLRAFHNETLAKQGLIMQKLDVKPRQRILDAGVGLNVFCVEMARLGAHVIAFDISTTKIRQLKVVTRNSTVDLLVADLQNLPFRNDAFDKALCSEVLEHIPNDLSAIVELARVIRDKGIIVITTPYRKKRDVVISLPKKARKNM